MNYRVLGKTGLKVSEIGFGAWGLGGEMWLGVEDEVGIQAVHRAIDRGVNFFDTALAYGNGHSERLLGKVIKEGRGEMIIATKIRPKNLRWPAQASTPFTEVFPKQHMIECTNKSLKNLGVDHIHVQQLHVWTDAWAGVDEIWETAELLKSQGKIGAFGISVTEHEPATALKAAILGKVDVFQVIYNIFDQSPEDELLPLCEKYNIGVIARVPFDEGGLTGRITPETTFPEKDWRNNYFRGDRKKEVFERAEKLKPLLGDESNSLADLALRFTLDHQAVHTVIPGMRRAEHVDANAAASDGRRFSAKLRAELKKHRWVRNWY